MIIVDFHSHTLFSKCGIHSIVEMLTHAKKIGMKALAITDHGPAAEGHWASPFFERLQNPVNGIRLLKGMEANFVNEKGEIDFPEKMLRFTDIVLVGFHFGKHISLAPNLSPKIYSNIVEKAFKLTPYIDIITHPNDENFLPDFERLAQIVSSKGAAIELNNSKLFYRRVGNETTIQLLKACKKYRCPIVLTSDAHAVNELGNDSEIKQLISIERFPSSLIVNTTANKAFKFVESRRKIKLEWIRNKSTYK